MVTNNADNIATGAVSTLLQGQGIGSTPLFTATPSVTSITLGGGNVLDTYVQGTFTPGIAFGGSSTGITYSSHSGVYTNIGNVVFMSYSITMTNKGSATGNATMTGLPINSAGSVRTFITNTNNLTFTASYTNAILLIVNASSIGTLQQYSPTAVVGSLTNTNFANNTQFIGVAFYYV